MTRYSVQPRNQIFVKDYRVLSFTRNMGKNVGKNISKNFSSKYSQRLLDHLKKSAADPLKTAWKRVIQKIAEATGDLIGNKVADRTTKVSKTSPKNTSETNKEEILSKIYVSPALRHKIIDDLRLKEVNYWQYNNIIMEYQKIINWLDDTTNQSSKFKTRN